MDAVIFVGFVVFAMVWHVGAKKIAAHKEVAVAVIHKKGIIGYVVIVVSSPAFWDGVREFMVHIIVYSGYIIPKH